MIGVSKVSCTNNTAPATALSLKGYDCSWIISGDSVYYDGLKVNIFVNEFNFFAYVFLFFRSKVILVQI